MEGFNEQDVLVTAEFLEINDKVLDILNSKSPMGRLYKAALSNKKIEETEKVFKEAEGMYSSLEAEGGVKIVHSKIKCGFLGLLADIQTVRRLYVFIREGQLNMTYLPCYKFSQDHLELLFNCIRLRNGWSYNPTPRYVQYIITFIIL